MPVKFLFRLHTPPDLIVGWRTEALSKVQPARVDLRQALRLRKHRTETKRTNPTELRLMKLFIGNLPFEMTEQEVCDLFEDYGKIFEFRRPMDRETGKPRGFAFITLGSREAGEKAIEELDGSKLGSRAIKVNEAEDRRSDGHPGERPRRVSMDVEIAKRVDDRPIGPDGKRVRYKGI